MKLPEDCKCLTREEMENHYFQRLETHEGKNGRLYYRINDLPGRDLYQTITQRRVGTIAVTILQRLAVPEEAKKSICHRSKDPEDEKPPKIDVYIITHERENGEAVDDASRKKLDLVREKISQIMREVFGEEGHGRVCCLGLGISPKQVGLTKPTFSRKTK
ncbi:uncharacterized protein LOC122057676 [Macadamia integrifolia]|uniref:uncharacterized protein LOC122057676 n=1 Tax=Macadamia integrifolia TaxID=60698 RepID=UPI001C52FCD3|nr:uncharacterized protein LOC122057676 [Macadamia integrifolia]XP_042475807.1 uncharacterized protein LOC122057676 [Macadamia integrifolia]